MQTNTDLQTDRQTDTQKDRHTDKQIHRLSDTVQGTHYDRWGREHIMAEGEGIHHSGGEGNTSWRRVKEYNLVEGRGYTIMLEALHHGV